MRFSCVLCECIVGYVLMYFNVFTKDLLGYSFLWRLVHFVRPLKILLRTLCFGSSVYGQSVVCSSFKSSFKRRSSSYRIYPESSHCCVWRRISKYRQAQPLFPSYNYMPVSRTKQSRIYCESMYSMSMCQPDRWNERWRVITHITVPMLCSIVIN